MIPPVTPSRVAYFSMEIALDPAIPTYSGGLGVLAGDTLRSAADLGVRMVAVTLLHRKGYFSQHLDEHGNQSESPAQWNPEEKLELMKPVVTVNIEGREVKVRAWRYLVEGMAETFCRSTCSTRPCPRIPHGTRRSRIIFMAEISTIASARKFCWAWEESPSCRSWATTTSRAIT